MTQDLAVVSPGLTPPLPDVATAVPSCPELRAAGAPGADLVAAPRAAAGFLAAVGIDLDREELAESPAGVGGSQ